MGKKGKQRDFADLPDYEEEDASTSTAAPAASGQGGGAAALEDGEAPGGKQAAGKKAGGKKKNAKKGGKVGGFDSDEEETTVLGGAALAGEDEDEAPVVASKPSKAAKGGKKKQQAKSAFELLEEDEDGPPPPAPRDDEEEDDSPPSKPSKKQQGKKGKSKASGFASLNLDEEEEAGAEPAPEPADAEDEEEQAPTTLVVGEITSARPHPKAQDKLKVVEVSLGNPSGRTYQVVTNALNAKRGMKVIFAAMGVTTATGIKVDQRTLKGIDSFGMLCQAADVGWTDVVDNKLVVMPDEATLGQAPPDEPPEELEIPKRTAPASKAAPLAVEEEEQEHAPVAKSGKKDKKGKKDTASLFAALEAPGDEAEEAPPAAAEPQHDEEEAPAAAGDKKGKKKKGGVNTVALFAALEDEGAPAEDAAPADEAAGEGKKKKKKGGKDVDSLFAALAGDGDAPLDAPATNGTAAAHAEEEGEPPAAGKKKKKKGGKDVDSLFAALAEGTEPEQPPAAPPAAPGASSSGAAASAPSGSKKGGKAPKVVDEELDALLAELDAPKPAAQPAAAAAAGGKKKKKGKAAAKEDEEDLDALLAAIDGPKAAAAPAAAEAAKAEPAAPAPAPAPVAADGGDDDDDGDVGGEDLEALAASGKELTAAQKKKLKKKQKEKEKKAAAKAGEEEGAGAAPATKGGKPVKESAMARKIREELERRQRAEEEARKAEEARREAELAEIRRLEEEEARKAEERRLKKEREKAKREQLKREGKLLTGKAKAEAERLAAMRAQLLKQAEEKGIDLPPAASMDSQAAADAKAAAEAAEAAAAAEKKPKKVVYMTKKQMQKKKEEDKSKEEEEERARKQAEEEAARKAQEEAEAAAKAAEEATKQQEAPASEEDKADDWEAAADDWENLDLDAVKAPIVSPPPTPTPAPEEPPAKAAAAAPAAAAAAAKKAEPAVATKPAPAKKEAPSKAPAKPEAESEEDESDKEEEESDEENEEDQSEQASASGDSESASGSDSESEDEDEDESDEESDEDDSSEDEESSDEDDDSDEDDEDDDDSLDSEDRREMRIEAAREKRLKRAAEARKNASKEELRSPICCILGHVDVGKTKILDNIRRTNVQDGEAGGITQQIGATFVPADAIERRTEGLRAGRAFDMKLPGLLVIDTPGHESFTNLRARGSGLCDIAVLIVDLMHGLEQQTIESINLLKMRKTPFIIALNKIDRLYGWKSAPDAPVRDSFKRQKEHVMTEFEQRSSQVFLQLNEQGLNVALYWKNTDPRKYVNIVPTSAITGEGIPDLLQLMVKLTQTMMGDRLMFVDSTECTVLEVKTMEGLGTTVDCVLVNGKLREGDRIVVCGLSGPIVTRIKALKTPQVLREMRVKGALMDHKEIRAAMGVKIVAPGLETAVAGTSMFVIGPEDDEEELKDVVMEDMADIFSKVDKGGEGVCVQASTLGSLEALLTFLDSDDVKIPVSGINIGPVHKRDVLRANVMNEKGAKKFAVILAFDVPVAKEARELSEEFGVRIFTADIIYHLFDQFTAYVKQFKQQEQEAARLIAIFPCILKILPTCIFMKKDPIVLGVEVQEGIAKVGTPICVRNKESGELIDLGRIISMELNHKAVDVARAGQSVAMKIEATNPTEQSRMYGRHFDFNDPLLSRISRESIDALKAHFRDEMTKDDWRLVVKLKQTFQIS